MKKKKHGFTMIEMLGVLVLLGIVLLIVVPTVRKSISDSKELLYKDQIANIESGIRNWASSNAKILPTDDRTIKLTLGQLKQSGHTEEEIKNPTNNKCFSDDSILTITRNGNNYEYGVETIIEEECSQEEEDKLPIKVKVNIIGELIRMGHQIKPVYQP